MNSTDSEGKLSEGKHYLLADPLQDKSDFTSSPEGEELQNWWNERFQKLETIELP